MILAPAAAILLWGVPVGAPAPAADVPASRLAAIERCQQGFADLGKATSPPSVTGLARACADIFREPACAAAMRDPPAEPAAFPGTITRACRDAYCPKLPSPRPKLCAPGDLPPPTELLWQWGELQQHIWAFELGVDPELLAPLFRPVVVQVAREKPPKPVAQRTRVTVYAKPEGAGRVRVWVDSGKGVVVAEDHPGAALARLARAARAKAPPDADVSFAVDGSVAYAVVITLIDAFKKEGFSRFSFAVAPADDPSP